MDRNWPKLELPLQHTMSSSSKITKLNTFFLDKKFQIKQRGENTCMVDFVWHNCKAKNGFQKYTYQKLYDEMEVYGSGSFPMMSTQELIDWAKAFIQMYQSTLMTVHGANL